MNNQQAALIAAAITCGAEGMPSEVFDLAKRYISWLDDEDRVEEML